MSQYTLSLGKLPRLKPADFSAAFSRWSIGGGTKAARAKRRATAAELRPRLRQLFERARNGKHRFSLPKVLRLPTGRMVADLKAEDAIVLGAIWSPFTRHPQIEQMLPCSFAYLPEGRGVVRMVRDFLAAVVQVSKRDAWAECGGGDIEKCFTSLAPWPVLTRMRAEGFAPWRCCALMELYGFWHTVPSLTGLTPGPSSSCVLADLALRPLDTALSATGSFFRYSDNFGHVRAGGSGEWSGIVETALRRFETADGVSLRAHQLQSSTYSPRDGFRTPFVLLGFEFRGHEVRVHPSRVERCRSQLIDAKNIKEAVNRLEGWRDHYEGLVPQQVMAPVVADLRRTLVRRWDTAERRQ